MECARLETQFQGGTGGCRVRRGSLRAAGSPVGESPRYQKFKEGWTALRNDLSDLGGKGTTHLALWGKGLEERAGHSSQSENFKVILKKGKELAGGRLRLVRGGES